MKKEQNYFQKLIRETFHPDSFASKNNTQTVTNGITWAIVGAGCYFINTPELPTLIKVGLHAGTVFSAYAMIMYALNIKIGESTIGSFIKNKFTMQKSPQQATR
jgi:hypothetical protein